MHVEIIKASGKAICRGAQCTKDTQYIAPSGRIKKGTSCAAITVHGAAGYSTAYYCRNCIDQVYEDVRKVLNPKLWIFH